MEYRWFEHFCNHSPSGYLKPWKCWSMWNTLENQIPAIKADAERLRKYLKNCLEMEGFSADDIETIAKYVECDGKI